MVDVTHDATKSLYSIMHH